MEFDDTIDVIIDNANVKLFANGNDYDLSFDNIKQSYASEEDIDIISGNTYGIKVDFNNREATAETIVPTKPVGLRLSNNKNSSSTIKIVPSSS